MRPRQMAVFLAIGLALAVGAWIVADALAPTQARTSAVRQVTFSTKNLGVESSNPSKPIAALRAVSLPRLGGGPKVDLAVGPGHEVLVVNFMAAWCPGCRLELVALASSARRFGTEASFVGVDTADPDRSQLRGILDRAGIQFPIGVDAVGALATRLGIESLPTTLVVSRSGRILRSHTGPVTVSQVADLVGLIPGSS